MKKYYLRLNAGMENQPQSEASAQKRNKIIQDCIKELAEQGLNIEAVPFGTNVSVLYDENGTPMRHSALYRKYVHCRIKLNRFIWSAQNKIHNFKMERRSRKAQEEYDLAFIDYKYAVRGYIHGALRNYSEGCTDGISTHRFMDLFMVQYNEYSFTMTKNGVKLYFRDKSHIIPFEYFDITHEMLECIGLFSTENKEQHES